MLSRKLQGVCERAVVGKATHMPNILMRVRHVRRDRWKCWMSSGLHITARGGQYSSAKVHRSVSVDADGTVNVDDASIPGLRYEVIEGR